VLERSLRDAQLDGSLPASLSSDLLADSVVALVQGGLRARARPPDPARMTRAVQGFCELLALLDSSRSKNPRACGNRSFLTRPAKSGRYAMPRRNPASETQRDFFAGVAQAPHLILSMRERADADAVSMNAHGRFPSSTSSGQGTPMPTTRTGTLLDFLQPPA